MYVPTVIDAARIPPMANRAQRLPQLQEPEGRRRSTAPGWLRARRRRRDRGMDRTRNVKAVEAAARTPLRRATGTAARAKCLKTSNRQHHAKEKESPPAAPSHPKDYVPPLPLPPLPLAPPTRPPTDTGPTLAWPRPRRSSSSGGIWMASRGVYDGSKVYRG